MSWFCHDNNNNNNNNNNDNNNMIMEYQQKKKSIRQITDQPPKFRTKKWVGIIDE